MSQRLDTLKGTLVPSDVHLTITRDYGEMAVEKSNELLWHMPLAVGFNACLRRYMRIGAR